MGLSKEVLEKRKNYITSTEVSALFGVSKYQTPFGLWHLKKGKLEDDFKENERMEWGLAIEEIIARAACEKLGMDKPIRMDEFLFCDKKRVGSSFDFESELMIIECKNVDGLVFRDEWVAEGDQILEAPLHIELQVQHQLLVTGGAKLILACLAGGNKLYTKMVEADDHIQNEILKKVAEFWASETPPAPDYEVDFGAINRLFTRIEPGEEIEMDAHTEDLCGQYSAAAAEATQAEKKKKEIKAQILERIGKAEKVFGENFKISRSRIKPAEVSYTRKGYTAFKVNKKKGK